MFVADSWFRRSAFVWLGVVLALGACARKKHTAPAPSASSASATGAPTARRHPSPEVMSAYRRQIANEPLVPVGPKIGLAPGQGAPPIMFGATVSTIERLMEQPCSTKTDTLCRYPAHALEFELEKGVLVKIHAHRRHRPAGVDSRGAATQFGALNGGIPADPRAGRPDGVALGMTIPGVAVGMGKPTRVEKVTAPNPFGTVERHYYPGAILEYDKFEGTIDDVPVLGGIVILPNDAAKAMIAREQAKLAAPKE